MSKRASDRYCRSQEVGRYKERDPGRNTPSPCVFARKGGEAEPYTWSDNALRD